MALANTAPSPTARLAYNLLENIGTHAAIAGAAEGAASNITDNTLNGANAAIQPTKSDDATFVSNIPQGALKGATGQTVSLR